MNDYLFLFTIGPVQSFIENSRKAMDLYAGSRFLSELMQDAVSWMERKDGVRVMFPAMAVAKGEAANIPNRLAAVCAGHSEMCLQKMAESLTVFIKKRCQLRCRELLGRAGISEIGTALAQMENFPEVYWAFETYDPADYSGTYRKIFRTIQEVKAIRPFRQEKEPWGRKCALFPEYNAFFVKKKKNGEYPDHVNPDYMCDITDNSFLRYIVKDGEALSSIAMIKRIYGKTVTDFYSIRRMLLESRVPDQLLDKAGWKAKSGVWKDLAANGIYDFENGQPLESAEYPGDVVRGAEQLWQLVHAKGVVLGTYFAIVKFDGDDMGKKFLALKTPKEQRELSHRISLFAGKAPGIFTKFGGLPVYAGGEDFLGFLPLDRLFACIEALQSLFYTEVQHRFSAGIAIAHVMQPLKEVMSLVNEREAAAKSMPGKNAAAVGIFKRSGNPVRMPACKMAAQKGQPQWKDMGELVHILKEAQCSKALLYKISALIGKVRRENGGQCRELMETLVRDCVETSQINDGISREELAKRLIAFYDSMDNPESFLQFLDGIAFLTREVV